MQYKYRMHCVYAQSTNPLNMHTKLMVTYVCNHSKLHIECTCGCGYICHTGRGGCWMCLYIGCVHFALNFFVSQSNKVSQSDTMVYLFSHSTILSTCLQPNPILVWVFSHDHIMHSQLQHWGSLIAFTCMSFKGRIWSPKPLIKYILIVVYINDVVQSWSHLNS